MASKQYGPPEQYEDKLANVMHRFGAEEYNFDWGRRGCWVSDRFRALAKERHPDVLKDDGTAFKALTQAAEDARRWLDASQDRR